MAVATQMATVPVLVLALKAGGDLSSHQHKFVKLNADNQVVLTAAITDIPLGILQNKPDASGKGATVLVIGVTKIQANAALSAGDVIGTSADGQADPIVAGTDTTVYVAGQVLIGAANAGEIAEAVVNLASPGLAA